MGNKVIETDKINKVIMTKSGDYYDGAKVGTDAKYIQEMHGWLGYSTVVEKNVYTDPVDPDVVRVQFEIKERPPAKVAQVIIVGNEVTQDRVIRRVVGLISGPNPSVSGVARSPRRNLAKLNIFKTDGESGVHPTLIGPRSRRRQGVQGHSGPGAGNTDRQLDVRSRLQLRLRHRRQHCPQ